MRYTYNKKRQGQTPRRNLTHDKIARLEEIGFKWSRRDWFQMETQMIMCKTFVQRCHHLEEHQEVE